jgi:hypothetical protein
MQAESSVFGLRRCFACAAIGALVGDAMSIVGQEPDMGRQFLSIR